MEDDQLTAEVEQTLRHMDGLFDLMRQNPIGHGNRTSEIEALIHSRLFQLPPENASKFHHFLQQKWRVITETATISPAERWETVCVMGAKLKELQGNDAVKNALLEVPNPFLDNGAEAPNYRLSLSRTLKPVAQQPAQQALPGKLWSEIYPVEALKMIETIRDFADEFIHHTDEPGFEQKTKQALRKSLKLTEAQSVWLYHKMENKFWDLPAAMLPQSSADADSALPTLREPDEFQSYIDSLQAESSRDENRPRDALIWLKSVNLAVDLADQIGKPLAFKEAIEALRTADPREQQRQRGR